MTAAHRSVAGAAYRTPQPTCARNFVGHDRAKQSVLNVEKCELTKRCGSCVKHPRIRCGLERSHIPAPPPLDSGRKRIKRRSLDSVVADRYPFTMSEAREVAKDQDITAVDLAWLEAALEEYKALLQYLREH